MGTGKTAPAIAAVALVAALALPVVAQARRNAYVTNSASNNISAYDISASTGALSAVSGSPFATGATPWGETINPAGTRLYVINLGIDKVSGYDINASTGALSAVAGSPFSTGAGPNDVAFNPAGTRLYVTNHNASTISAYNVNASTGALALIGSPSAGTTNPTGIVVNPAGTRLYVAGQGSDNVAMLSIDPSSGAPSYVSSLSAGGTQPVGISIDPAGKWLYTANFISGNVSGYAIDGSGALSALSGSPFASTGTSSNGAAVSSAGNRLYVTNPGSNSISSYNIDASTGVISPVSGSPFTTVGTAPAAIGANAAGTRLYAANVTSGNVSGYDINASSGALTAVAGSPFAAGTSPTNAVLAIAPNQSPTANFTSTPATAGSETVLNASSSTDDGGVATYSWNFGDSTAATTSLASVAHTYAKAGTYNVTLTVNDGEGCTGFVWAGWTAYCNGTSVATKSSAVTIAAAPGTGTITISSIKSGESALTATLTCTGGPCTGKVSVITKRKYSYGKKRRHKRRPKKKQLVLGSKTFSLSADQKSQAKIVYSKKVLKALKKLVLKGPFKKKGRRVPVLIKVESGGKTTTRTESIKFKVKKKRKHRK